MLDPLTAFSAAGTVAQFVDIGAKILSAANEIRESATGCTVSNGELWQLTEHLSDQVEKLSRPIRLPGVSGCLTANEARFEAFCQGCQSVGNELLAKLSKQRSDKKGKWKGLSTAMRVVWSKNDILRLERRLQGFKDMLNTEMVMGLRESMDLNAIQQSERFNNLEVKTQQVLAALVGQQGSLEDIKTRTYALTKLLDRTEVVVRQQQKENHQTRKLIVDLLQKVQDGDAPFANLSRIRGRRRLETARTAEGEKIKKTEARIMNRLWFPTKDDRKDTIAKAHQSTFQWMYEVVACGSKPWSSFVHWLRGDGSIYWIAGKAGSGKSTLMKFIHENPKTIAELRQWSNDRPLLTASHFFWNSGTAEQRSYGGLIQSLLHDILEQEPALISVAFPSLWAAEYSKQKRSSIDLEKDDGLCSISLNELMAAFERLLTQQVVPTNICLFIDGLDEYEGDKIQLAELITKCSSLSTVKFCVSSRPLIPLEDRFGTFPKLLLQDLTAEDIKMYVATKLKENQRFEQLLLTEEDSASQLINEIVSTANGVFLWVRLATRSLIEGITNHDTVSDLRKRLSQIPTELVGLYEHMLNGIDPFYQAMTSEIFQTVYTSQLQYTHIGQESPLSLIELSFSADEERGLSVPSPLPDSDKGINSRMVLTGDQVKVRCAGLLESESEPEISQHSTVRYIHWTAREYLESKAVRQRFCDITQGTKFNANIAYIRACVSSLGLPGYDWGPQLWQRIITVMWHCYEADAVNDYRYIALLNELDVRVTRIFDTHYAVAEIKATLAHWTNFEPTRRRESQLLFEEDAGSGSTFLSFAIKFGLTLFVKEKLGRGDAVLRSKKGQPLLDYAVHRPLSDKRYKLNPDTVAVLFQHGSKPSDLYNGSSCWEKTLDYVSLLPEIDPVDRVEVGKWISILELFLEYGAYANQRTSAARGKHTALSVVTETLVEWEPLQAAKLHQMLVSRGGTINNTVLQKQADSLENAIEFSKTGAKALHTKACLHLQSAHKALATRSVKRTWRSACRLASKWSILPFSNATHKDAADDDEFVMVAESVVRIERQSLFERHTSRCRSFQEYWSSETSDVISPTPPSAFVYVPYFNVPSGILSSFPLSTDDFPFFRGILIRLAMKWVVRSNTRSVSEVERRQRHWNKLSRRFLQMKRGRGVTRTLAGARNITPALAERIAGEYLGLWSDDASCSTIANTR